MSDSSREIWKAIRASGKGDGEIAIPSKSSGIDTGYGPARYAVGPKGEPRLLVPCGDVRGPADLGSGANLIATRSHLMQGSRSVSFLDVMLLERRLDNVFAELVSEVFARLEVGQTPHKAVAGTISDFRDLLQSRQRDVSGIAAAGLIGELVILEALAGFSASAVQSWTGPYEQRHDFRRAVRAIEVKTSMRSDSTRVTIHGAEQLLPPGDGSMHLAHVRLEQADAGSATVSRLRERIIGVGVDATLLDAGLSKLDYDQTSANAWDLFAFEVEGIDFYLVSPDFPRITSSTFGDGNLPYGIVALNYEIDLAAAKSFCLSAEQRAQATMDFMQ